MRRRRRLTRSRSSGGKAIVIFLPQTLQAREQQRRANALADRQREEQVERLAVIELKSAEPDTRCHAYAATSSTLCFDYYAASCKAGQVSAQRAQADADLRGERAARRVLVGSEHAQESVQPLAHRLMRDPLQRCHGLAPLRCTVHERDARQRGLRARLQEKAP
jgi:hypothetical protein